MRTIFSQVAVCLTLFLGVFGGASTAFAASCTVPAYSYFNWFGNGTGIGYPKSDTSCNELFSGQYGGTVSVSESNDNDGTYNFSFLNTYSNGSDNIIMGPVGLVRESDGNDTAVTFSYTAPTQPSITWANPADITYGTALSGTQLDASVGGIPGTFDYTPATGTVLQAGSGQMLSVTFMPTDSTDYSSVTQTVSINVIPAPLTITADAQTKVYGASDPTLTASYSGFVNGDTASSLTASPTLTRALGENVGSYAVTASGAVDPNYVITYVPGTLTITPAPLTVLVTASPKVYDGTTAEPTFTLGVAGNISGDDVSASGGTASFASADVGTGIAVTASGYALTGAAAGNYTIQNESADTTADITEAAPSAPADVTVAPAPAVSSGGGGGGGIVDGGPLSVGYVNTNATASIAGTGSTGGQVLGAAAYNFTKNLTIGSAGADVTALQNLLIADGYLASAPTGYFGALTKAAVIKFQAAHTISPQSGYIGPLTRGALNAGATPATPETSGASTSTLTSAQIQSVLLLLQSFDVDAATINNIQTVLNK
jgi:hypothetical protein